MWDEKINYFLDQSGISLVKSLQGRALYLSGAVVEVRYKTTFLCIAKVQK